MNNIIPFKKPEPLPSLTLHQLEKLRIEIYETISGVLDFDLYKYSKVDMVEVIKEKIQVLLDIGFTPNLDYATRYGYHQEIFVIFIDLNNKIAALGSEHRIRWYDLMYTRVVKRSYMAALHDVVMYINDCSNRINALYQPVSIKSAQQEIKS